MQCIEEGCFQFAVPSLDGYCHRCHTRKKIADRLAETQDKTLDIIERREVERNHRLRRASFGGSGSMASPAGSPPPRRLSASGVSMHRRASLEESRGFPAPDLTPPRQRSLSASGPSMHVGPISPPLGGSAGRERRLSASGPSMHNTMTKCSVCRVDHRGKDCPQALPDCKFCGECHVLRPSNFRTANCLAVKKYDPSFAAEGCCLEAWKKDWRDVIGVALDRCFPSVMAVLYDPRLKKIDCVPCKKKIPCSASTLIEDCIQHYSAHHQA